jgi:hypothetical protein
MKTDSIDHKKEDKALHIQGNPELIIAFLSFGSKPPITVTKRP